MGELEQGRYDLLVPLHKHAYSEVYNIIPCYEVCAIVVKIIEMSILSGLFSDKWGRRETRKRQF